MLRDKIRLINKKDIKLNNLLAVGGFGKVFATQYDNKPCVVKEFEIAFVDPQSPDRNCGNYFLNEILNCAVLKYEHPNVQ